MATRPRIRASNDSDVAESKRQGIQSLEIGFKVLTVLADTAGPMNLRDIAQQSGMSASKVHRYLVSLINTGAVRQDPGTSRYDLGDFSVRLGLAGLNRRDAMRQVTQTAIELNQSIDRTILVSIWGQQGPTVIAWYDASEVIICNINLGTILPLLRTASGRLFLSYLPRGMTANMLSSELAGIVKNMSDPPVRTRADVARMIQQVRTAGYDMTRGEFLPNLAAVASPVFDHQGRMVAAIAALGIAGTLQQGGKNSAAEAVRLATRGLSHRLGYTGDGRGPSLAEWLEGTSSSLPRREPPALRIAGRKPPPD